VPPQDAFDLTFDTSTLEATGFIKYKKQDEIQFLCAFVVQADASGEFVGGAYGSVWDPAQIGDLIDDTGKTTKDNPPQDQPTWRLKLEKMAHPDDPAQFPDMTPGQSAMGIALYRVGGTLEGWATPKIMVTDGGATARYQP